MATIHIRHEHAQPEHRVRALLDALIAKMGDEYEFTCTWHGNRLDLRRSGASGSLTVQPHCVEIELKLSMFLSMLEGKIRKGITEYCQENLP